MTAAHPTLPIPSYVRVTNVGNGRSVVVRVNDRGPFLNSRLIDLSYTAAAKLGYVSAGSAEVEVELIMQFDQRDQGMQARAAATTTVDPNSPGVTVASGAVSLGAAPEKLQLETVLATAAPVPGAASSAPPAGATIANAAPGVYLQLGAFSSRDAAESTRTRIARDLDGVVTGVEVRQEGALFKIQAGPYSGRADALAAADRIRQLTAMKPFAVTR
jgi:rare lipoprotein A